MKIRDRHNSTRIGMLENAKFIGTLFYLLSANSSCFASGKLQPCRSMIAWNIL